ncbi:inner membrane protein [Salmonella enterica subsp. enterica serovar Typhimurium str. DT104]|nr:inner membrane protein [Salmonella enterica subsp. enterica serovar Typhimurium str. DT104]CRE68767.1 inner membrane protein [Salmonella enterica subsp. enterica serovar Typhimurium str. DT104]CRE72186.1 inner membrane protein [Salmonella enterica subsp. enterica serovar Typhimurium str. DT104]
MNSTIWLALALVLVLEGLGPMLYPGAWKKWFRHWRNCRKMFYVVLAADLWSRELWSTTC